MVRKSVACKKIGGKFDKGECETDEPIVTVRKGETFGSVAWQKRVSQQVTRKVSTGKKLTPAEKSFIGIQLKHEERYK